MISTERLWRRRPWPILVFGVVFVLAPLLHVPLLVRGIAQGVGFAMLLPALFLVPSFAVGLGLLMVRPWGLWLFYPYAAGLLVHNVVVFVLNPIVYNLGALLQISFLAASGAYFMRRDVWIPYLQATKRAWRQARRQPLAIPVAVDGLPFHTVDLSGVGAYLAGSEAPFHLGQDVTVRFADGEDTFFGTVVRVDPDGFGLAFRFDSPAHGRRARRYVKSMQEKMVNRPDVSVVG